MKTEGKYAQIKTIGRCQTLLETMETRLAAGRKGWKAQQRSDWETLRMICNQQLAQADLIDKPDEAAGAPQEPPIKLAQ